MARHSPRFLATVNDSRQVIRECSVNDVKRRMDKRETFHLIDVREESEWANGHLPGAIHLGKGVIERDIEGTIADVTEEIVLYCGGGYRSALAADALQQMGYENVISMDGGYRGWTESGYEIDADPF